MIAVLVLALGAVAVYLAAGEVYMLASVRQDREERSRPSRRPRRRRPGYEFELRESHDRHKRLQDIFWLRCSCGKTGNSNDTPTGAEADFDEHAQLHEQRHRFTVETDGTTVGAVRTSLNQMHWVTVEEVHADEAPEQRLGRARWLYGVLVTALLTLAVIALLVAT